MIRRATDSDISALKAIWEDSFDDPLNYVDFMYNEIVKTSDTIVFETANKPVSMLTVIPAEFTYKDKAVKAIYIFAAATLKKYRAKGIMTSLLKYAEDIAKLSGCALSVLVPAEKYLFKFYQNCGYSADFNATLVGIKHGMIDGNISSEQDIELDKITPEQIYGLRESVLAEIPHIRWYPNQLKFIMKDARIYDEHIASYSGSLGIGYAIFGMQGKHMFIKECMGTTIDVQHFIISKIIAANNPKNVSVQLPLHSELFKFEGETTMYGMAKPLAGNTFIKDMDPYMNLMLD
ncbi:MAG: GNAT family N-acetyltransferase [Oscillospiraceae bacterium]